MYRLKWAYKSSTQEIAAALEERDKAPKSKTSKRMELETVVEGIEGASEYYEQVEVWVLEVEDVEGKVVESQKWRFVLPFRDVVHFTHGYVSSRVQGR